MNGVNFPPSMAGASGEPVTEHGPATGAFANFGRRATISAGRNFKMLGTRVKLANRLGGNKNTKKKPESEEINRLFTFDPTAVQRGACFDELFEKEEVEEDFNDIVHLDDERVEEIVSQDLVGQMVESLFFRLFILGIICVNSVLIGLQTMEMSEDYMWLFNVFDNIVLTIFVCELALKWYNGFFIYWRIGWNVLDFFIILTLLLGPTLTFLGSSRILRILRVLRAFRSLRSVSSLAGLSVVVQTIFQSIPDMTNIALLLIIIMLVLSVAGVSLFGRDFPDDFGDLGVAMFSMFVCVTQDGWMGMYSKFKGTNHYLSGGIYFIVCIIVGAFVFANLIIAVVVTNLDKAMNELKQDKKQSEDTLATKPKPEDGESHVMLDAEVPLVSVDDIVKNVDMGAQKPLLFGDFKNLTTEKLQNYIIILTAIEENLAEYKRIRKDLEDIFDIVWRLNEPDDDDTEFDLDTDKETLPDLPPGFDIHNFGKKGDIMSNLMELGKQKLIDTRRGSLKEMVREAAKLLEKYKHREAQADMERQTIHEGQEEDSEKESDKED
ncbi:cation channel sperm-associated protein 4-like [Amphiura filiformis]|uniref:cation channel sperm-associated protein 4-like n=1 Tax=Amphiura filiformis TaxID=82378 RepID=UPI003B2248F8